MGLYPRSTTQALTHAQQIVKAIDRLEAEVKAKKDIMISNARQDRTSTFHTGFTVEDMRHVKYLSGANGQRKGHTKTVLPYVESELEKRKGTVLDSAAFQQFLKRRHVVSQSPKEKQAAKQKKSLVGIQHITKDRTFAMTRAEEPMYYRIKQEELLDQ